MKRIESLKLNVEKYLRAIKIFRIGEAIVSLIVVVLFIKFCENIPYVFIGVAAVVIPVESFLAATRSEINIRIENEHLIVEKELGFYSEMKSEFEKFKNEFILKGSKDYISEECQELVWKEEMGIGWLSLKIKELETKCDEAQQNMKQLSSLKRLVIF